VVLGDVDKAGVETADRRDRSLSADLRVSLRQIVIDGFAHEASNGSSPLCSKASELAGLLVGELNLHPQHAIMIAPDAIMFGAQADEPLTSYALTRWRGWRGASCQRRGHANPRTSGHPELPSEDLGAHRTAVVVPLRLLAAQPT
jgi:hypothetical protein